MSHDVLIIGAGLSGAVTARKFAEDGLSVLVIDKRDHIGGNCYDYIEPETGILVSKYGIHLFHTSNQTVWEYINKFGDWQRFDFEALALVDNMFVPVPVNITTVNTLLNLSIRNEKEMDQWLEKTQIKFDKIVNSQQMGLSRVGKDLYEKIFKCYTFKQWKKYPEELDPSILGRIPVRNNFDPRYFTCKYQVYPKKGYTFFINNILTHQLITTQVNVDFFKFKENNDLSKYKHIIYTGPIDAYYADFGMEKLEYRSLKFQPTILKNTNFFQTKAMVNYPGAQFPFTRIIQYKHLLNQKSKDTIIFTQFPSDEGEPYYPVASKRNLELFEKYKDLSKNEKQVHFLGRLANYKYFNMDEAIFNALQFYENTFAKKEQSSQKVQKS